MKAKSRRIKNIYHTEVQRKDGGLEVTFHGENSAKKLTRFIVQIDWGLWRYAMRDVQRAWNAEREARIAEIQRVNEAMPAQPL